MKILFVIGAMAAALTAALVPAFAGGPGGSGGDSDPLPITIITAGPAGPTSATSAEFMFTADQQKAKFFCALDTTEYSRCATPVTYSGLANGLHTFSVYAQVDLDKSKGPPATWSWAVDTVPPAPVHGLHSSVAYGKLRLSWTQAADTDHVVIFRSVGAKTNNATQVYAGVGRTYTETKVANGIDHRYAFVSFDKAGNASPPAGVTVKRSALLVGPANGATVRRGRPLALRWRAVRRARFYNVQLWRGKQKVLSKWPHRAHTKLSRAWKYNNRAYHLEPGLYAWFVWPAFGRGGAYGKLVGIATFRVR